MISYLFKRFLLLFVTLWGITLVGFVMLQMAPGSPIEVKLRQGPEGSLDSESQITEEIRQKLREQYHLDKPILVRYGLWLKDVVQLDFGNSFHGSQEPVIDIIMRRLPISLTLGLSGILVALLIGIPIGILSARFQGSLLDRSLTFLTTCTFALPSYLLGILLLLLVANPSSFQIFPSYGLTSSFHEQLSPLMQFWDKVWHFVLPCFCYSIGGLAIISQQQRNALLESMEQDYVRTARAKGLSEFLVVFKHAFRNSLIPILTLLGGMIPSLLGASIVIEYLFSIEGLGALMLKAVLDKDYPLIMANFTLSAFLVLIGILVSDILYMVADPRIKLN